MAGNRWLHLINSPHLSPSQRDYCTVTSQHAGEGAGPKRAHPLWAHRNAFRL